MLCDGVCLGESLFDLNGGCYRGLLHIDVKVKERQIKRKKFYLIFFFKKRSLKQNRRKINRLDMRLKIAVRSNEAH